MLEVAAPNYESYSYGEGVSVAARDWAVGKCILDLSDFVGEGG